MVANNNVKGITTNLGAQSLRLFLILLFVFSVSGCDNDGPLEEAGESVDEAVSDTQRAVEDAVD